MSIARMSIDGEPTACQSYADLFLSISDAEDHESQMPLSARHSLAEKREVAAKLCADCPMHRACLTQAVVGPPIHGYVAGTTQAERKKLQATLNWSVDGSEFTRQHVDQPDGSTMVPREMIDELCERHPDWHVSDIARAAGCSSRTVSRHLARRAEGWTRPVAPTPDTVIAAARQLLAS